MAGGQFAEAPAGEDDCGGPAAAPLVDPLQVPDSFATHLAVEILAGYARITAAVARTNPYGERERSIVTRNVLTTDDLFRNLEELLGTLAVSQDPAVQRRLLAMMERLMTRIAETSGPKN